MIPYTVKKRYATIIRSFSKNRIFCSSILCLLSALLMAGVFSDFCKKRVESQTKEWVLIDSSSSTGGHLVTKFSNLITLVNSRGDTKGIALYSSDGLLEKVHTAEGCDVDFANNFDVESLKTNGSLTLSSWLTPQIYTTYTAISDDLNDYVIAFHFICDDFLYFYFVFIAISFFTLFFNILMDRDLQRQVKETFLSSYIGTIHEFDSHLVLANRICQSITKLIKSGKVRCVGLESLASTFMKANPLVEVMKKDMLNIMKDVVVLDHQPHDINRIYSDFKSFYIKDTSHVTIKEKLSSTLQIHGDYSGLLSIISNLMSNAFKFADGHKIVVVKSWDGEKGRRVFYSVSTSGSPLTSTERSRIFEAFHRLTGANGSGLGLWIVDRHVKAHNGSRSVQSKDGFNTFTVSFPAVSPLETAKAKYSGDDEIWKIRVRNGSFFKVLLLDDEIHTKSYVEERLKGLDYHIDYFPNIDALKESINAGLNLDHDLLLLDRYIEGGSDILKSDFPCQLRKTYSYEGPVCLFTSAVPGNNELPKWIDFAVHKNKDFSSFMEIL